MAMAWSQGTRWNIFARELADILAAHNKGLGHLDDMGITHSQKVSRLQRSLTSAGHFPTLNPEEIEALIVAANLDDSEQNRLRAAVLATAVERILMDRMDPHTALMASEDVFAIFVAALREQSGAKTLAHVRAGGALDDDVVGSAVDLDEALDWLDRATLELHTSRNAVSPQARVSHAQLACAGYARALELLERGGRHTGEDGEWRYWRNEALRGRDMAKAILDS